jgi:hypothetical protein
MIRRILLSAAALIGSVRAAENPVHDVTYTLANPCPQGGCPMLSVDKGYLFQMKPSGNTPANGFDLFDPAGRLAYQVDITAPDGSPGHLIPRSQAWAADTDGTVLVPISYGGYGGNGHVKGGGIVVLDQGGKQIRFVDSGRFLPDAACFGPDHSIWVIGTQFAPLHDGEAIDQAQPADYNLVRHYSPAGKQIGSFLPRSLFPPGLAPGGTGWIRASRDRIGAMTYPGQVGNYPEWVELDLEGKLLGRWKLGPQRTSDPVTHNQQHALEGFAFTADGRLFAQTLSCPLPRQCSYRLESLDRVTSTWEPVDHNPVDRFRYVVGADGNDVVLWDRSPAPASGVHLLWVQPGQQSQRSV